MKLKVKFLENEQRLKVDFGEVHNISDGGYERGYEAGYTEGQVSVPDYLSMRIDGTLVEYSNENIKKITNYSFYNMPLLESVDLPNVTTVGGNAFMNCYKLHTVNLPKVTSLANYVFQGCSSIEKIDLPSLMSIQGSVFTNNTALVALILRGNNICSLGNGNSFNNSAIANGTGYIYVPDHLVESYKTANNWSTYASQIRPLSELEG